MRTAESFEISMSGEATQLYKAAVLEAMKHTGLDLQYAYGNATTDICAYSSAGIDPLRTFILGPNAGRRCPGAEPTVALASYTDQLGAPILKLAGVARSNPIAAAEPQESSGMSASAAGAAPAPLTRLSP